MQSKLNWKYMNILLVLLIIYMLYILSPLWGGLINTIISALLPIMVAFVLAFVYNPLVTWLEHKKVPRLLGIVTMISLTFLIFYLIVFFMIRPSIMNFGNLIEGIEVLFTEIGGLLGINPAPVVNVINQYIEDMLIMVERYFAAEGPDAINAVIKTIILSLITFIIGILLLLDFNKLKDKFRFLLKQKENPVSYLYVSKLNKEMTNYLISQLIISVYQFCQYTLIYWLIGHPNYLILGIITAFFSLLPYVGGYISNSLALVMAIPVSTALVIRTAIVVLILPNTDAYLVNPRIYRRTVNLNALLAIVAMLLGEALFGIVGIIIAIPLAVIIVITHDFFKEPIREKVRQFKESL